jgi:hypothetical protein
MMSEEEVRQVCADLELVLKAATTAESAMCVAGAYGAVKFILGEIDNAPARVMSELRNVMKASKARNN